MKIKNNFSIFYSYKTHGDVLIVSFKDEIITSVIHKGSVEVCYNKDDIITLRFNNMSKIIKIHSSGLVALPNNLFIDILNNILKKEKIDVQLAYKDKSDFVIGKVVEINKVDVASKVIEVITNDLKINDFVVVANKDIRLATGKWTKDYQICTYKDLHISDDESVYIIDEECQVGTDFYNTKEI